MPASELVICPYDGEGAILVRGDDIYPHRPDLRYKFFYRCPKCQARVGCHPNSTRPLGRLANSELRIEKSMAHTAFDVLWKLGNMSRPQAYAWLSEAMGIPPEECHIGMFDLQQCRKVVELVKERPL